MKQIRNLLLTGLMFLAVALGVQAKQIGQYPNAPGGVVNINDLFILEIQSPHTNYSLSFGQLTSLLSTNFGTNVSFTYNITTNVTFLTQIATNPTFISLVTTNPTFITAITTNNQFLLFINTNFYTNITVTQNFNLNGKASLYNITVTNSVASHTNLWAGPTNSVDFNVYEQNYVTFTPFNFSGFVLPTNAPAGQIFLQIYNGASTNVTGTWPTPAVINAAGTPAATTVTVTNGTVMGFWLHYTKQGFTGSTGRTNGVATQI